MRVAVICPLCDAEGALVTTEEFEFRVACEPCGGSFIISRVAVEEWAHLGPRRAVALEQAREYLANRHPFVLFPKIEVRDVWAWGATS